MIRRLVACVVLAAGVLVGCEEKAPKWGPPPPEKRRAPGEAPPPANPPAPPTEPTRPADQPVSAPGASAPADPTYVLSYRMRDIDGNELDLSTLKGKVVLLVNVASRCGLTPQYEGLQALYAAKKDAGLVVLGVPSNDFNGQEPGTEQEIKEFCTGRYGVTFPMLAKISVRGEGRHALYAQLASLPEPLGGEPRWNFTKFLIDRSGRVVARFEPRVTPGDAALVARVDELLGSG